MSNGASRTRYRRCASTWRKLGAGLRQEMATGRIELFKWSFLFWIGQVLATAGLMAAVLRLLR